MDTSGRAARGLAVLLSAAAARTAAPQTTPPAPTATHAETPAPSSPTVPDAPRAGSAAAAAFPTTARLLENQLELRDARTNAPLIARRGLALVESSNPAVQSAVTLIEKPDGADLVFDITNTSKKIAGFDGITVGVITLGSGVTYTDFRDTCDLVAVDANTFAAKAWTYPGEFYCPAMVLSSPTATVGVSLQYPVLEYMHDVRVSLSSPPGPMAAGEGGRGWALKFQFTSTKLQSLKYEARLRPGETRRYTVSVRATAARDQWVRTLGPYRDHFLKNFGGVQYARATAPVLALPVALDAEITDDNPQGWSAYRPDLWGFGKLARALRTNFGGWSSIMLYNPSGLFKTHRELNPPFQFATPWTGSPLLATAEEERAGLPTVAATGRTLGLWWGNAARVMSEWDANTSADFDPAKPEHVKAALAELDQAVKSGATVIGLGNFSHDRTPAWKQYHWLLDVTSRYPGVKFVLEPSACDFLHTLAPTLVVGHNDLTRPNREADLYTVTHPNTVADFLVPGHETWATFRYDGMKRYFNTEPDEARIISDMQAYAGYGYVPCFFVNQNIQASIVTAESWKVTVPPDLQLFLQPLGQPVGAPSSEKSGAAQAARSTGVTPGEKPKRLRGVTVRHVQATDDDPRELGVEQDPEVLVEEALRRARGMSPKAALKEAKSRPTRVTSGERDRPDANADRPAPADPK